MWQASGAATAISLIPLPQAFSNPWGKLKNLALSFCFTVKERERETHQKIGNSLERPKMLGLLFCTAATTKGSEKRK